MANISEYIQKIIINIPFAEGSVNAYILTGSPVTLVDTGISTPESLQQLQHGLGEHGLSLEDVEQVVVTHLHTDHAGGVREIQQMKDIPVYVHEHARGSLTGGESEFHREEAFFRDFFRWCGAEGKVPRRRKYRESTWRHIQYVADGDEFLAGGRHWEVVHVPGHSQTDIVMWDRETGDAIVGDHLLKDISANAFMEPPPLGTADRLKPLLTFRKSMTRTRELPFQTIYPGHGEPYEGHRELIEQRFTEHDERCQHILSLLIDKPQTVYELSTAMFPWLEGPSVFLGLSEVQGHLDLLAERLQVTAKVEGGVATYHADDI